MNIVARFLLLVSLAMCGSNVAIAADYPRCTSWDDSASCADEGRADIASREAVRAHAIAGGVANPNVCLMYRNATAVEYGHQLPVCNPAAGRAFHKRRIWPAGAKCENRANERLRINLTRADWAPTECHEGCRYNVAPKAEECIEIQAGPVNIIGNNCYYKATPSASVCSADDPPRKPEDPDEPPKTCGAGQKRLPDGKCADKGDCPAGQHMVAGKCTPDGACPTGQTKGPDGSCVDEKCPAGQAKAKDGTCKKDDDGDGNPNDGEDTGKFSGGDDCDKPPQCSGDNILCGQARIQWRIDCNTRRNRTITGGRTCGDVPICTGEKCDALEYAQLLQQWRATCAVERMASQTGGGVPGPANDYTLPSTDVGSGGNAGGAHPAMAGLFTQSDLPSQIGTGGNSTGFGLPRSCPLLGLPNFEFKGQSVPIPWDKICTALQIFAAMILLAGHIQWAYIVGKIGS